MTSTLGRRIRPVARNPMHLSVKHIRRSARTSSDAIAAASNATRTRLPRIPSSPRHRGADWCTTSSPLPFSSLSELSFELIDGLGRFRGPTSVASSTWTTNTCCCTSSWPAIDPASSNCIPRDRLVKYVKVAAVRNRFLGGASSVDGETVEDVGG